MNERPLKNQTAIVSGALGDIGRAVAVELARAGADVALSDIAPPEKASPLLAELRALDVRTRYDRVDVADGAAVDAWVSAAAGETGVATLVVTCAATVTIENALRITAEQWRRELAVNLDGSFHVARAGARGMIASGRQGRIVFVGSWAAHVPHAHIPAYSAAKAGVRMLCQCLAAELAMAGILVNEVAPGFVDAGLSAVVFRERAGARDAAQRLVPTGRLVTASEVAEQVAYLCSGASRHMTGSVLLMDGGLSLRQPMPPPAERPR